MKQIENEAIPKVRKDKQSGALQHLQVNKLSKNESVRDI